MKKYYRAIYEQNLIPLPGQQTRTYNPSNYANLHVRPFQMIFCPDQINVIQHSSKTKNQQVCFYSGYSAMTRHYQTLSDTHPSAPLLPCLPGQDPDVARAVFRFRPLPEVRVHAQVVSHAVFPPVIVSTKIRIIFTAQKNILIH